MKLIMTLLICLVLSFSASAQKSKKYKIKVVEFSGKSHRGLFYAAEDKQLIIITKNGDTSKLQAENISKLYIHKPGIVAPIAIAGAAIFVIAAVENPSALIGAVLIIVGVPVGVSLGLVIGELFANKRYYKKLQARDFPLIKADLQRFTLVK